MIDLWNPAAWDWTKDIIKTNLVAEGKGAGWMHDFGEYLPFDAVVYDGTPMVIAHN
jgi:alpha-glucosidase